MLGASDREWEDTGWLDWWAALYCDESFVPCHRMPDEPLAAWDEDDYTPTLTRWKRAGAAPWPTLTTWPGWPLPQLGVPHMCQ